MISLCVCVLCVFLLFLKLCFIYLPVCFLKKERKKEYAVGWVKRLRISWRSWERETHDQNMLYEKMYFNKKECGFY